METILQPLGSFAGQIKELFSNCTNITWQQVVMWCLGGLLIFLAIKKNMEPSLLLPMGFGAILVNLPFSGAITQFYETGAEEGPLSVLFDAGIANELFPLLLFVGIGAMIDFTPLLTNPKLMIFGAAGISAFPMSARVVHKMGLAEDNQNFLLMHAVGVNVSGQIASVIAGGMILNMIAR